MLSSLENAEEVLQILERFTKQKSKDIPPELDEYLNYVAKTGDTVYRWPTVQYLFHEKLSRVIKEFHDTTASIEGMIYSDFAIVFIFLTIFFSVQIFRNVQTSTNSTTKRWRQRY